MNVEDAVDILGRTPGTLRSLLGGLPEIWIRSNEGAETWSPYEVVGHLIHGERTDWIPRARHILADRDDPFESFDRTAMLRDGETRPMDDLLDEFASSRAESIESLIGLGLGAEDLARAGTHPELGRVTLGQLIATWVVHDLDHVAQIARTMAKIRSDDVGPWRAYLSILEDRR
jgi:hypothetical protein